MCTCGRHFCVGAAQRHRKTKGVSAIDQETQVFNYRNKQRFWTDANATNSDARVGWKSVAEANQ